MKNKILVILCLTVCIVFVGFGWWHYHKSNINDQIKITVAELSVKDLDLEDIYYAYEIPDDVLNNVKEHKGDYKIISANYVFENLSEDTRMEDVRFYPDFGEELSKKIVFYNSGNEEYYIYIEPGYSGGMQQDIIVNAPGKSAEEMYEEVKGQKIKMVYYAGLFGHSMGEGYTGPGSHSIEFLLQEDK